MNRRIRLTSKDSGLHDYFCAGDGCEKCHLRFTCFTEHKNAILSIDWHEIRKYYTGSPSMILRQITHSKIYVSGSKKFIALVNEWDRRYFDDYIKNVARIPGIKMVTIS